RRKSRDKLSLDVRDHGKIKIRKILAKYNEGDRVVIKIYSSYHDGMPHPKYHGFIGIIKGKRGDCYEVLINDKGKEKLLIVHPVHLEKLA
ncbi:MAG: 50S ribosomal protein L21e, partial [Nanopusillaceae archaeon]